MTARGVRVEVTEELVATGSQRADIDDDFLAGGHHLLTSQIGAFELLRRWIGVLDVQLDLLIRWDGDLLRLEAMVAYD
jgi:hypothetical protein